MTDQNGQDRNFVASLSRGLSILELLGNERRPLLSVEISALLKLNRATTRRFLLTLTSLGYVEQRGKYFSPTAKVVDLGYSYFASKSFFEIADPIVHDLSVVLQETASMAILDGPDVVYVCRAEVRRLMSMNIGVGTRLPAYVTSTGKALLAYLPQDKLDEVLNSISFDRLTPLTASTRDELIDRLAKVRELGYAVSIKELEMHLKSIAVPVRDARGQVIASINIATLDADVADEDLHQKYLPRLLEAASKIQRSLVGPVLLQNSALKRDFPLHH